MNRDIKIANYLLAAFGSVSALMLSLPLTSSVKSLKAGLSYLVNPLPFHGAHAVDRFAGMPSTIVHLISADIENRALRQENSAAALMKAEIDSLRKENERLRGALGLKPREGQVLLWARIIQRDALGWYRAVMIDAGEKDGVEMNAPVLGLRSGNLGAVGRVTEVGPRSAKVLLLTDELSSLAAYIPSSGWEGLVEGQGTNRLRMNYLPPEAQFKIGDLVYTSATSATFPPDILIGGIARVFSRDPFLTFQSVEVTPTIRSESLQEVMVLARKKSS